MNSNRDGFDHGSTTPAPWFYRKRFAVFGLVYGVTFFIGYLIAGFAGISVPVYRALGDPAILGSIAWLLVVAGFALRVWASSYLSGAIVSRDDPQAARLRVSGPYRFTRNPLYLGNILQAIGIGLVTPWPVFVLVSGGVIVFDYALILVEEPFLSARQGEAYRRYCAAVPRLVPMPRKPPPDGRQSASLGEGLRTEASIGLIGVMMFVALFAYTVWVQHAAP